MLEYVHGGDEIERRLGQLAVLQVYEPGGELSLEEAPFAKIEQNGADVGERDVEAVPRKQQATGADAGTEVEHGSRIARGREFQRGHIRKGRIILIERMPPHEFIDERLGLVIEALDMRRIGRLHLFVPGML